jgi:hypothetical protein
MIELLLHLVGDYLLQNDWMAQNKTKSDKAAFLHALVYSLPFALIVPSVAAWVVIFWSHYFIDRYRLAVYWIRFVNSVTKEEAGRYGYSKFTPNAKPEFMAFWLMVIIDNTLHLVINHVALNYLK